MTLKDDILEHIKANGPVSVADYMGVCAAHYYASHDPFGVEGDFITAPEISQVFGEMIGAWLYDRWQHTCGSISLLCELGPGRGTLMKDILRATRNTGLHESIDVLLVEASPRLREMQERALKLSHTRISWRDSVDNLPPMPLFLVANEFFDALPVHQYVAPAEKNIKQGELGFSDEELNERKIAVADDALFFTPDRPVIRETSPISIDIMKKIARHIKQYGGLALIIDYGYASENHADTVQAVKAHQYTDPLTEPGEADITAHVDFLTLKNAALSAGVHVWDIVNQGEFLTRIGAGARTESLMRNASREQQEKILSGVERLVAPEQMGGLFKVMAVTSDAEKPPGF